jgi:predicted GNAT family acetyltransferase
MGGIVARPVVTGHRRIPVIEPVGSPQSGDDESPGRAHHVGMVVDVPERSRVEIRVGDEAAGFTEYRRAPGRIAFIHTSIDPRFEGQGLGSELVRTALSNARAEGLAVLPFCPFVRSYIAAHPEYLDLVPEDMRAMFELPAHA